MLTSRAGLGPPLPGLRPSLHRVVTAGDGLGFRFSALRLEVVLYFPLPGWAEPQLWPGARRGMLWPGLPVLSLLST